MSVRTKREPAESLQKQLSVLAALLHAFQPPSCAARELPLMPECSSRLSFILILNRVSCCFGKQITLSQQKGGGGLKRDCIRLEQQRDKNVCKYANYFDWESGEKSDVPCGRESRFISKWNCWEWRALWRALVDSDVNFPLRVTLRELFAHTARREMKFTSYAQATLGIHCHCPYPDHFSPPAVDNIHHMAK